MKKKETIIVRVDEPTHKLIQTLGSTSEVVREALDYYFKALRDKKISNKFIFNVPNSKKVK